MDARRSTRLATRFLAALAMSSLSALALAEISSFGITQAIQLDEMPPAVRVYLEAHTRDGSAVAEIQPRQLTASLGEHSLAIRKTSPFRESGEGVAYVFLIDVSRSLSASDFNLIREELTGWIQSLTPLDRVAVIAFGNESRLVVDFTPDRSRITTALASLGPTDDRTVLHEAVRDGLELCGRRDLELPGRRVILVLSDGRDEGSALTADDVLTLLRRDPVPIHAIGLSRLPSSTSRQAYLDLLRRFAANSGGTFYESVPADLGSAYDAIRRDIRDLWIVELACSGCRADGEEYRLQIHLDDRGRVLSDGRSVRLLPVLRAEMDSSGSVASAPGDTATAGSAARGSGGTWWLWLLFPLLAAGAAAGVWIAVRRRRHHPAGTEVSAGEAAGHGTTEIEPFVQKSEPNEAGDAGHPEEDQNVSGSFVLENGVETTRPPRPAVMRLMRLIVVRGTNAGRQYTVTLFSNAVIGSRSTCDCVLQEPGVAPEQFEIYQLDGRVYIRNLSEASETLIDGLPVTTHHPLRSGALVGTRDFIVRIVYEEARTLHG
jgi:VWFA-related protein